MSVDDENVPPGRAAPTMKHVATHAGVGLSTVSRVVNGDPRVSPEKRAAVLRSIDALGYRRNESARHFRTGSSEAIGLVIEDVTDPFFSILTESVEDAARAHGSMLLVASYRRDADRARDAVESLCSRRVDGLIVTPAERGGLGYLREEIAGGTPMVFVDRPAPADIADAVITDNRRSARDGVDHLIAHGHRRIACLSDRGALFTVRGRIAGYRDALTAAGIPVDESLVHSSAPDSGEHAPALRRMLASDDPPTAVFTCNNRTTMQALRELARAHPRPAILGFDDLELADSLSPGLSVIAQDPSAMGRTATEMLFARITGTANTESTTVRLPTRLIRRGSAEQPPENARVTIR